MAQMLVGASSAEVLHAVNKNGDSPLMWACANGHLECARYIVESSIPHDIVAQRNRDRINALMCGAMNGNEYLVQVLLRHGADPNAQDVNGNSALHYAIRAGHAGAVRVLVDNGADLHVLNNRCQSAFTLYRQDSTNPVCHDVDAGCFSADHSVTRNVVR